MFGLSRIVALLLAFSMGFGLAAGMFIGIPAAVLATYSLRDLENSNLVNIPDEKFIQPDEEGVDILDLNAIELYYEYLELQSFGEALNLNLLQKRYGLLFHEKLDKLLTEEARTMPMSHLLSMEGVHTILNGVYIGFIENYKCLGPDGNEVKPETEGAYWYDETNDRVIKGLEEKLANYTIDDFIDGRINVDTLLHEITIADIFGYELGDDGKYYHDGEVVTGILGEFAHCHIDSNDIQDTINGVQFGSILGYTEGADGWYDGDSKVTGAIGVFAGASINTIDETIDNALLGDLLGYVYDDGKNCWVDNNNEKVTGVMGVVADCSINNVGTKIQDTDLGNILGFTYNESENWWYDENGKVHTFMNTIAGKHIDQLGNLVTELKVSDVIPEEQRQTGLMSLLNKNTTLETLAPDLDKMFNETTMKEFIDAELITFGSESDKQKFLSSPFANYNLSTLLGKLASLPIM